MNHKSEFILRYLIVPISILFLNGDIFSQKISQTNCLYIEAAGNGFFGSINYERQILKVSGLAGRIGVGFNTDYFDSTLQFHYPLVLGFDYFFMLDSGRTYIDVGYGQTWLTKIGTAFEKKYRNRENIYGSFILSCGYRRIFKNDLMFRISLLFVTNEVGSGPYIGASIGKSF